MGGGGGGAPRGPTGIRLLLWLGVAILAHILVALFGVLNRWLQVDPSPPVPAMRLAVIVSLMALGSVATVDCAGRALRWGQRARQRRRHGLPILAPASKARRAKQQQNSSCSSSSNKGAAGKQETAAAAAAAPSCCCISADGSRPLCHCTAAEGDAAPLAALEAMPAAHGGSSSDEEAAAQAAQQAAAGAAPASAGGAAAPHPARRSFALAQQQAASFVRQGSEGEGEPPSAREPPPRPELALARGLSRRVRDLGHGRPRLVRLAALSIITASFSAAYCCQIVAPGFVDPSLVQLVNMFTVLGVALVQSFLLNHRLPLSIWPCSAVMLGGAAMVIVPTIGSGSGAGLSDWRGWLGFGLSLASMATTVVYFVSLQASRRLGFTSLQLQYLYLLLSVAVLLPISLGVEGTDWASNFRGWTGGDWAVLCVMSCCVVIGANLCIQHSTWVLGAPTVSMFYGLRLVAAIVESKLILGATVIKKPVQAITVYMFLQWRRSKQQAAAEAQAATDGAQALGGDGEAEPSNQQEPPQQRPLPGS